jgi:hypothetical protein
VKKEAWDKAKLRRVGYAETFGARHIPKTVLSPKLL